MAATTEFTGSAWPSNASTPRRSADTASLPALQTNTGHQRTPTPSSLQQSDAASSRPKDFEGEVATDDALPSVETVRTLQDHLVLDKEGKTRTFRSLYNGKNSARRVLVIFIRHFFCGNCQDYLRTLCESVTPEALLRLPISTSIVVIGCGDPGLISMYIDATGCPFPIYTDPSRKLFDTLGMIKTLAPGVRPAYQRQSMASSVAASLVQGLKQLPTGLATRSGDHRQVGGEFLFEPVEPESPVPEISEGNEKDEAMQYGAEEKRVSWCHRMKTTRDHTEVPVLRKILGMDS